MFAPTKTEIRAQRETERLERVAYFKEMERRTKEIEEGRCAWINELMQDNDEPLLADEAMIEEF